MKKHATPPPTKLYLPYRIHVVITTYTLFHLAVEQKQCHYIARSGLRFDLRQGRNFKFLPGGIRRYSGAYLNLYFLLHIMHIYIYMRVCVCVHILKHKSVAYRSQGNHTSQLDFCNWLADGITTESCD